MPTRNPLENDEYPEKPCPECGTTGEHDIICRVCGWTVCMACFEGKEWHIRDKGDEDCCRGCKKEEEGLEEVF